MSTEAETARVQGAPDAAKRCDCMAPVTAPDPSPHPPAPPAKCAHIPDVMFLSAVNEARWQRGHDTATRWDVAAVLLGRWPPFIRGAMPAIPERLVVAKARKLIRRGLLDGCACGCRGDWSPTKAGDMLISSPSTCPPPG